MFESVWRLWISELLQKSIVFFDYSHYQEVFYITMHKCILLYILCRRAKWRSHVPNKSTIWFTTWSCASEVNVIELFSLHLGPAPLAENICWILRIRIRLCVTMLFAIFERPLTLFFHLRSSIMLAKRFIAETHPVKQSF